MQEHLYPLIWYLEGGDASGLLSNCHEIILFQGGNFEPRIPLQEASAKFLQGRKKDRVDSEITKTTHSISQVDL